MDAGILTHLKAAAEGVAKACTLYEEAYGRCTALRQKVVTQTQSLISLKQHQDWSGELRPHFEAIEASIAADEVASREAEAVTEALREDLLRQGSVAKGGMQRFLASYRRIAAALDVGRLLDNGDAGPKAYDDGMYPRGSPLKKEEDPVAAADDKMPGHWTVLLGGAVEIPAKDSKDSKDGKDGKEGANDDELINSVNRACIAANVLLHG